MKHILLTIFICTLFQISALSQNLEQDLSNAITNLDSAIEQLDTGDLQSEAALKQSAAILEQVMGEHDVQSPGIYHALGNAYMLQGDTGRAVLAYRRGEILDPTNSELRYSLAFARSSVSTQVQQSTSNRAWKLILSWRGYIPRHLLTTLFLILFTVGWVAISAKTVNFGPKAFARLGVLLIAGSVLPAVMLGSDWYHTHSADSAIVTQSETFARTGPDDSVYNLVYEEALASGIELRVIETRDGWSHAELWDGTNCWIPQGHITHISP